MLVATPGQTAAYHPTLHSSGSAPKQICHTSSSSALTHTSAAVINKLPAESSSVSSSLMKTLSVRLNRGTEFLKGTVQKALISTSNTTAANTGVVHSSNIGHSAATSSGITFSTSTAKSLNTIGATTSRLAGAAAPSSALLKLYTVPPTVTHRYPEQRLQASSVDSLYKEMCHFKPIRSAPITPLKSGSKSRGASLKVPKAKLASKVNLHLNRDESAIWLGHDDDDVEDDEDEQEGENNDDNHGKPELDSVKHFRPKPGSTLLTTIISTPKHKSAFVCLVAQMKNLATLPKSKLTIKPVELQKKKSSRGRTKYAATISSSDVKTTTPAGKNAPRKRMVLRNCRNPFVHVKKLHLPAELISKSFRAIRQGKASKSTLQQAPKAGKGANSNNYNSSKTENHKTGIVKAKSRAALKKAKSKVVNIVKLAQKNNSMSGVEGRKVVGKAVVTTTTATMQTSAAGETPRNVRKRKLIYDLTELEPLTRKSARISKDCSNEATRTTMTTTTPTAAPMATGKACRGGRGSNAANSKKTMRKAGNRGDTVARLTPPLTRSRLKEMSQCKLLAALEYRHRII